MAEELKSARNKSLDTIKGGLIFLVVFAHLLGSFVSNPFASAIYNFIYTFHMPAFVFISGFLSKGKNDVDKMVKNIAVPFLLFNFIYELQYYIENGGISGYIKLGAPYWIMWFLLSLMTWRLLTPVFLSFRYPVTTSIALSLFAQFADISGHPFSILRTFSFMPFYVIGLTLNSAKLSCLAGNKLVAAIIVSVSASTLFIIGMMNPATLFYGAITFKGLGVSLFTFLAVKIMLFILVPALIIALMLMNPCIHLLGGFGVRSLYIFTLHGLFIPYISRAMLTYGMGWPQIILSIAISLIICLVFSRKYIASYIDAMHSVIYGVLFNATRK